jgi:hypothetical protein
MNFKKASYIIFNKSPCVNLSPKYLIFVYVFIALGILLIPSYIKLTKSHNVFLKYYNAATDTVFTISNCDFDWWSVSHFMLYTILGFAFPHLWLLLAICSISWELLEFMSGYIEHNYVRKNHTDPIYWCGKWSDLLVNSAGFLTGLFIRYIVTFVFI